MRRHAQRGLVTDKITPCAPFLLSFCHFLRFRRRKITYFPPFALAGRLRFSDKSAVAGAPGAVRTCPARRRGFVGVARGVCFASASDVCGFGKQRLWLREATFVASACHIMFPRRRGKPPVPAGRIRGAAPANSAGLAGGFRLPGNGSSSSGPSVPGACPSAFSGILGVRTADLRGRAPALRERP